MRFLMKVTIPTEAGNAAAQEGFALMPQILAEQKPEAVYFIAENGNRTALLFINMDDSSQLPAFAEPWFLAFGAKIEATPAMNPDDLAKAGPAIEQAVNKYGKKR